jgi:putative MFS transporter
LRIALLAGLAFAGNGLDAGVLSFALPGVRAEWDLSPLQLGLLLPVVGLGQFAGAILAGGLADRFGRRLAFSATGSLAGLGFGLAGLAPHPGVLAALLFVGGLGFGGVAPVAGALVSEFAPPAFRGRLLAWTQVLWVLGWSAAATGGGWFAEQLGWRGILGIGAAPIAISLLGWLAVPESPRFLLARGRRDAAEALSRQIARRHGVLIPLGAASRPAHSTPLTRLGELWSRPYRRRTFTLWTTWIAMNAAHTGPVLWLPVIFADRGPDVALRLSALVGYAMLPATLASVLLIDRVGRRPLLLTSLGAAAAGGIVVALSDGEVAVMCGAMALAGGILAAWPPVLAWASEQYPTRIRATAAGWGSGFARLGAIAAPVALGVLLTPGGEGRAAALLPFAALLIGAIAGVAAFGKETAGRSLEELSAREEAPPTAPLRPGPD